MEFFFENLVREIFFRFPKLGAVSAHDRFQLISADKSQDWYLCFQLVVCEYSFYRRNIDRQTATRWH